MQLIKNKVGRPSNEVLKKRKRVKLIIIIAVAFIGGGLVYSLLTILNIKIPLEAAIIKPENYKEVRPAQAKACENLRVKEGKGPVQAVAGLNFSASYNSRPDYGEPYYAVGNSKSSTIYAYGWGKQDYPQLADKVVYDMDTEATETGDELIENPQRNTIFLAYQPSSGYSFIYEDGIETNNLVGRVRFRGKFVGIVYSGVLGSPAQGGATLLLRAGKKYNKLYIYYRKQKAGPEATGIIENSPTIITLYKNPTHTTDDYNVTTQSITYSEHARIDYGKLYVTYNVTPKSKPNIIRNYVAVYSFKNLIGTKDKKIYPDYTYKYATCDKTKSTKMCRLIKADSYRTRRWYADNKNKKSYFCRE